MVESVVLTCPVSVNNVWRVNVAHLIFIVIIECLIILPQHRGGIMMCHINYLNHVYMP